MSFSACTIVSRNYLSHARILAESFVKHEPKGRFYLLVVDRLPEGVELPDYIELIDPDELGLPYFYEMCFKYDVTELSTAVKPTLLSHLMSSRGETRLCYFDPDILVCRPMAELRRHLQKASIVLVPHLLDEIPLDGRRPNEQDILIAGSYNLGFIGLREHPDTARLLQWWAERLRDLCRVNPAEGLMTDQRWIDLVPGLFPSTSVLFDETYDVAYWNLHSRELSRAADGSYLINGRPLSFFHFSGFKPTDVLNLSKHQDRFDVSSYPALHELLTDYAELHEQHQYATSSAWEYGYSRFSNGIAVHPILRQLYLGLDPDSRTAFGDPFNVDGKRSFLKWATNPRGEHLSRFLETLYRLRFDLMSAFPDVNGRDREGFLNWAATQGVREERYSPELVLPAPDRIEVSTGGDEPAGAELVTIEQTAGVNVIGYLRSESGLGAAARAYIRALRSGETPISLIDIGHLTVNRTEDPTITEIDDEWRYDVNLVVVNADEHFRVASELGEENFRSRYNIGVWAWELPVFPEEWHDRFPWYDEIWVGSSFIAGALSKVAPMPVVVVPPVLALGATGAGERGRGLLGATPDEFVFAFVFDFHSFGERKNPLAAVEAFKRAFGPGDNARLVIKCVNGHVDEAYFSSLQAAAQGHRIDIHSGYWPAQDVHDVIAGVDAYVSLHRSEGTGLTLSDAMAHGKPVIATGWSGNTDFMNAANSYPVDYELIELEQDVGPYLAGQTWADPSVAHAAELMRHVFEDREGAAQRAARARRDIEAHFSEARVAEMIAARLAVIAGGGGPRDRATARVRPAATKGHPDYDGLIARLGMAVEANTPPDATLAIVSRGDERLLELGSRVGWHFPRNGDGAYAGYYPADSESAIAHLEQLRGNGAGYLVIPASCGWWLEHYEDMRQHLESRYEVAYDDPAVGTIFRLTRLRRADVLARVERLEQAVLGETHTGDERVAALTSRLAELDRIASALERRLTASLAWGETAGDLGANVRRTNGHQTNGHHSTSKDKGAGTWR